jgi:hypothetical protein
MHKRILIFLFFVLFALPQTAWFWGASPASAQVPHIVSTSPAQNELNVSLPSNISVVFDTDMDESTINSSTFIVNARSTGLHQGTFSYDDQTYTATFDPNEDFEVGEVVTVVLTTGIESSGGTPLDGNYAWSFTIIALDGTGNFGPRSDYDASDAPNAVFAADLDADGDIDLATSNGISDDISVLLNNGDATFATHSEYPAGDCPRWISAADLDADGDIDLATANSLSDNVSVLLNNDNATFAAHVDYSAGDKSRFIFAADLDSDGDIDLVTANENSDNVSVLLNNGNATFAARVNYSVGDGPYSVFAADLDGDGDIDLATANRYSDNVSVLMNNGDGTFAAKVDYTVGEGPKSVFAADLDGDGDIDLVITNKDSVEKDSLDLATADEESAEPATANKDTDNISVLLNEGDGTFAEHVDYPVTEGLAPRAVFAADLDGDGDIDLAVISLNKTVYEHYVSVLLNNGDAIFGPPSDYLNDLSVSVFAADLDADGDLDLVSAIDVSDKVSVFLNGIPPYEPSNPDPHHTETDVDIDHDLSWTGGDPDPGDIVTYDVYFGESSSPPQVETDWPSESYDPGTLNYETTYHWSIVSRDNHGETTTGPIWYFTTASEYIRGDANGSGSVDLADAVFIVNWLFIGGPPPDPMEAGDANCSGGVDLADAVYIVNWLFIGGPPPGCE